MSRVVRLQQLQHSLHVDQSKRRQDGGPFTLCHQPNILAAVYEEILNTRFKLWLQLDLPQTYTSTWKQQAASLPDPRLTAVRPPPAAGGERLRGREGMGGRGRGETEGDRRRLFLEIASDACNSISNSPKLQTLRYISKM